MSKPRPEPHAGSDADFLKRTLRSGESFEDVMCTNPQESRPVLVSSIQVTDDNSFKFSDGLMMTWNGVIIDIAGNDDDCTKWLISEPHRRLDGSIHYADGWRRDNNGRFMAPSGLVINPDLSVQHKNGITIYNDGLTISPSGQRSQGRANSVGIIYRVGVGAEPGLQFQPIRQPAISAEAAASIHHVNFMGRKSMNHVSRGVLQEANVESVGSKPPAADRGNEAWGKSKGRGSDRRPSTGTGDRGKGAYVPPHRRILPKSSSYLRKTMLDLDEIRAVIPYEYRNKMLDCGVKGCGVDMFGMPMCVDYKIRSICCPYVVEALAKYNVGKI
jgi:hypothetical protein